jgi:hypothetical protein
MDDASFAGVRGLPVATLALRVSEFRSTLIRHLMHTWQTFSRESARLLIAT